jgi:hypothetical protein
MTAPLPHGYPDWGRYEAGADKLLYQQTGVVVNASTDIGPFFLGDVPYFRISFGGATNNFRVTLNFYDTSALTSLIGQDCFDANAGDLYNRATPTLGAYLVVNVTPSAAASIFGMTLTTAHAPWVSNANDPASVILFEGVDVSHPIGITFVDASYVVPGWAQLHGRAIVAATEIDLYGSDYLGVLHFLNRIENANGMVTRAVFLPPMHLRLRIRNLTAGAQLFTYSLQSIPGGDR